MESKIIIIILGLTHMIVSKSDNMQISPWSMNSPHRAVSISRLGFLLFAILFVNCFKIKQFQASTINNRTDAFSLIY